MGQARIRITWELLQQFLQIPQDYSLERAEVEIVPGATGEPTATLHLFVRADSIAESETPRNMLGTFKSKEIENEQGRWMQGEWKIE